MADLFYVDPSAELNQGDIVDHIPWGLIEAPTTLCRPNNRQQVNGKAFYGSVQDLKNPPPWTHDPEFVHGIGWNGLVMVLWHGCQLDKWKNRDAETGENTHEKAFAAVAPIKSLEEFQPEDLRGELRAGQHQAFFPLPALTVRARQIPESYVDLRHIWSVRQRILTERIASLTEGPRLSLYEHLFTFFTRFRLDLNPTCPKCGEAVPLVLAEEPEEPEEPKEPEKEP